MKMKSMFAWLLALGMLSSCSKDDAEGVGPEISESAVAYLSVNIHAEGTRAGSIEDQGLNESDIKKLYLLTFDTNGDVVGIPGTTSYFIKLETGNLISPDAQKISAKSKSMLVIANPGTQLESVITNVYASSNFAQINTAIKNATKAEITDDVSSITKGFAMISSLDDGSKSPTETIDTPLIDITGSMVLVTGNVTEADAKNTAQTNRLTIKIERLASKIELKLAGSIEVKPTGAQFTFANWTLDGVNSTFYPFAKKHILSVTHTQGDYKYNFYTEDPNYTGHEGIDYATVEANYKPKLVSPYTWMGTGEKEYCIENTMAAAEQKFGNATRVVIKATYYPGPATDYVPGTDWYSFAGVNYKNFDDLKTAYGVVGATNLQDACDDMWSKIDAYATANPTLGIVVGSGFTDLTQTELSKIQDKIGGEILKNGSTPVIRWYQEGQNYYYYEIRHDNETTTNMAFGKYGVVRNNWYELTLSSVSGPGTPWYPDIDNPGPGDPDPIDPIDDDAAYLGITVKVQDWILWKTDFGI